MRELKANLETARDRMRRVELEWDRNLEGVPSRTGSIRVIGVPDYKEKGNPVMVAGKHRKETSGEFYYHNSSPLTLKQITFMFVMKGITEYKSLMNLWNSCSLSVTR